MLRRARNARVQRKERVANVDAIGAARKQNRGDPAGGSQGPLKNKSMTFSTQEIMVAPWILRLCCDAKARLRRDPTGSPAPAGNGASPAWIHRIVGRGISFSRAMARHEIAGFFARRGDAGGRLRASIRSVADGHARVGRGVLGAPAARRRRAPQAPGDAGGELVAMAGNHELMNGPPLLVRSRSNHVGVTRRRHPRRRG